MDLSREDFEQIRKVVKNRSGIWLSDAKLNFLKLRLAPRLRETSMETARDYYYFLKYDSNGEKELDDLVDAVAVNETYFFREEHQLKDFMQGIIPQLSHVNKGMNPLSIWSAACSTGEEPYTLAMLLLEHASTIHPSKIRILASDISQTALHAAREGIYDNYSLRYLPESYRVKYFDETWDGRYAIKNRVKQLVNFGRINLMDSFAANRVKNMECIFCRNVLIYFDDVDKSRCINNLYQSLVSGGYLLLGHSESLARISDLFEIVRMNNSVLYKKP